MIMKRVIAILLDAADPVLVDKWIKDGTLPNLKKLRSDGVYTTISSKADWIASIPWASLYTGWKPQEVDIPYVLCWNPQKMTTERLESRAELIPFWRQFDHNGPRSIILDMP